MNSGQTVTFTDSRTYVTDFDFECAMKRVGAMPHFDLEYVPPSSPPPLLSKECFMESYFIYKAWIVVFDENGRPSITHAADNIVAMSQEEAKALALSSFIEKDGFQPSLHVPGNWKLVVVKVATI